MPVTRQISLRTARRGIAVLAAIFLLSAGLSMCLSTGALAHAFLDHAIPLVGSTVHGSPAEVKVWFTQEIEPAFSTLRVVDQNGTQVDKQNKTIDPKEPTLMKVSLPTLPPGKYKVFWHVLSVDTHTSEGTFTFDIVP